MKFHWFHLMPYPQLPENFKTDYRSVWVDVPSSLFDPKVGHKAYNDYLDELEYAESVGFDGICVNEHHQNAYGLMPSPNLIAASLARRTSKAKLVVMGNSVALYDPPTRVAEEMAMLDCLSGGRLVAGFPVGTPMDTVYAYGKSPATLRDKYYEGVKLILRAWTEPQPFAFNGKYTQLRYVNVWPRPIQKPHPPVWIPGGGSVETWDWCVDNDFLYANLSYFGYIAGQKVNDGFWEVVEKKGKDKNPYRCGFLQFIAVARDDAEAEKLYSGPATYFYSRCLHTYPGFGNPPGYTSIPTMRAGIESMVARSTRRQDVENLTWKEMITRGYVVAGSPESVRQQLENLTDKLHVGHLMVLAQYGDMSKEVTMYNTTLFAKEVMPKLRYKFGEYEDKWWPSTGLDTIAEPAPLTAVV